MAGTREFVIRILGDDASAKRALGKTAAEAEKTGRKMGDSFDRATSRVGGLFSKLGNLGNYFGVPLSGALDHVGAKFDEAKQKGHGLNQGLSALGGATALALGAGLLAVGAGAVKMADEFEPAHARLQAAIHQTGSSFGAWSTKIDDTSQHLAQLGFGQADVEKALALGVIATQNTGKALGEMGLAADLARTKHLSLEDATQLLTRALSGNSRVLKSLGIDLPIPAASAQKLKVAEDGLAKAQAGLNLLQMGGARHSTAAAAAQDQLARTTAGLNLLLAANGGHIDQTSKAYPAYLKQLAAVQAAHERVSSALQSSASKSAPAYLKAVAQVSAAEKKVTELQGAHKQILDALSQRLGGQASAYAHTFTGKMQAMRSEVQNLGIKLGDFLIPKIQLVMTKVSEAIGWFEKHKRVAEALAIAIGVVLGGAMTVFAVNKAVSMVKATAAAAKAMIGAAKVAGDFAMRLLRVGADGISGAARLATGMARAGASVARFVLQAGVKVASFVAANVAGAATAAAAWVSANSTMLLAGGGILAAIAALVFGIFELIKHWKAVWHAIESTVMAAVRWIKTHWMLILPILLGPLGVFILVFRKWHKQILAGLEAVGKFFVNLGKTIVKAFEGAGKWLLHAGGEIIHGLWCGVVTRVVNLYRFLYVTLPLKIIGFFAKAGKWLLKAGEHILEGLLHGIEGGIGKIGSVMAKVGKAILHSITSFFGIFSPSRRMAGIGANLMEGLAVGITGSAGSAHAAMQSAIGPLSSPIRVPATIGAQGAIAGGHAQGGNVGRLGPLAGTAGAGQVINVNVTSHASPVEIGRQVVWASKTAGG